MTTTTALTKWLPPSLSLVVDDECRKTPQQILTAWAELYNSVRVCDELTEREKVAACCEILKQATPITLELQRRADKKLTDEKLFDMTRAALEGMNKKS